MRTFEKVQSITKVQFNFFLSTNMDTNTNHFTSLMLRMRGATSSYTILYLITQSTMGLQNVWDIYDAATHDSLFMVAFKLHPQVLDSGAELINL